MIVASICTIPQRIKAFEKVINKILFAQTTQTDYIDVWLNGFTGIPIDFPSDNRIHYKLMPSNPGPWIRYQSAEKLINEDDVLITLDDDLDYPNNYIEMGLKALPKYSQRTALCYSAISWDPFVDNFEYGYNRWQYMVENSLSAPSYVALLKGQTGFIRSGHIPKTINLDLPGFQTNDDMLIGNYLFQNKINILCMKKEKGWIKELPESRGSEALFRTDSKMRHETFRKMVYELHFDPTANRLTEFLRHSNRILVLANLCPPMLGTDSLHNELIRLCKPDTTVHLLGYAPAQSNSVVQEYVDTPYNIHPISYPEQTGRFTRFPFIQNWRQFRIQHYVEQNWKKRLRIINDRLKPTKVLDFRNLFVS